VRKNALSNASKTNWAKVDAMTDEEIDYTDSPEVTEEMFKLMHKYEPSKKITVNLRMDKEIVDFFKEHSHKYHTKINEVLAAFVRGYKKAHNH
jgi:uncharacterized protein (DUF4415 family)